MHIFVGLLKKRFNWRWMELLIWFLLIRFLLTFDHNCNCFLYGLYYIGTKFGSSYVAIVLMKFLANFYHDPCHERVTTE